MAVLHDRSSSGSLTGRDIVRAVAAYHFGVEPADVELGTDDRGKPRLVGAPTPFAFNLSDADDHIAVAFALGCEVGVDIERADRRTTEPLRFARRVLSDAERSALDGLDDDAFQRGLIRCWTRKEAVLKASGHGLRRELGGIDTSGDVVALDGDTYRVRTVDRDGFVVSVAWTQDGAG